MPEPQQSNTEISTWTWFRHARKLGAGDLEAIKREAAAGPPRSLEFVADSLREEWVEHERARKLTHIRELGYNQRFISTYGDRLSMNTVFPSKNGIERKWHVLDAEDAVLGRLASKAAMLLMGKTKAIYTPFIDTGDHVVVINAEKVRLTGNKEEQKIYRRHSGYPGGLTEVQAKKVRATRPTRMIEEAIQGMLPKNKLGKQMYRKLNVYAGDKHPHQAQKPVELALK